MKKYVKDNLFFITFFIVFFVFTLLFPYSGDDWVWGTYSFDLNTLTKISYDTFLNGRYIGTMLAILMTRNTIIRGLVMSLTMTGILYYINRFTKGKKYLSLLVIVCMPAVIFKQVIPWSSGFANYTVSVLVLLAIFDTLLNKDDSHYMLGFLLCFIGSLFVENFTIFILGLTIFLNVKYFIKNKKINKKYILALLGSLLGTFIMFSHPGYITTLNGSNEARYVQSKWSLISENYFYVFSLYGISANYLVLALLEIMLFVYYYKNDSFNKSSFFRFILSYIMLVYIVFSECIPKLYEMAYLNGIVSTLYLIILLSILYSAIKKKKDYCYVWYIVLLCILIIGPLIIVSPLGPRNMFIVYLLVCMMVLRLYNELFKDNTKFDKVLLVVVIGLSLYFIGVFNTIHKVYVEREDYIMEHSCKTTIYVPRMPHHKYLWWPDFEYELGDYYPNYYKKYRDLNSKIYFVYEDYDFWLKHKDNMGAC